MTYSQAIGWAISAGVFLMTALAEAGLTTAGQIFGGIAVAAGLIAIIVAIGARSEGGTR